MEAKRVFVVGALLLMAATAFARGVFGSSETVEYSEDLSSYDRIEIRVGSPDVFVRGGRSSARFEAQLDSRRTVDIDRRGSTITIEVRGNVTGMMLSERVDITLPDGVDFSLSVGSADVEVDGGEFGTLTVGGGSSDLSLSDVSGEISANTGSGDIDIEDAEGTITIEASSGDVDVRRTEGVRSISTGSGRIVGRDLVLRDGLALSTGSGDIDIELDHDESDMSVRLSAGSGDLRFNRSRGDRSLQVGGGPIQVTGSSGSGDQSIRTR